MTDDIERGLRDSLADRARHAPGSARVIEQVLATVPARRPARRWRNWSLPLVSAAAVAVVAGTVVGVTQATHSAAPKPAPPGNSAPATGSAPISKAPPPLPSPTRRRSSAPAAATIGPAVDLTFVGSDAWALTAADKLLHSSDGGASWQVAGSAPAGTDHLRFATPEIGYAFSRDSLYLTLDGGANWQQQPGGADALETLNGNVIRLVSDHSGCPGPCNLRVEVAPIGSSKWHEVPLPITGPEIDTGGVMLVRADHVAVVLTSAGQAGSLHEVVLYTSMDDGVTWTRRTDPCRSVGKQAAGVEVAATDISAGADGSVTLLCQPGGAGGKAITVTSADGGATFRPGTLHFFECCAAVGVVAASVNTLLVLGSGGPLRSTDGGQTWSPVPQPAPAADNMTFAGFETTTVGHMTTQEGRVIWTTRDGGATWTSARLP